MENQPIKTSAKEISREVRQRLDRANSDDAKQAQLALKYYKDVGSEDKKDELARAHCVIEEALLLLETFSGIYKSKKVVANCVNALGLCKPKLGFNDRSIQNSFDRAFRKIKQSSIQAFLLPNPSCGNKKFTDDEIRIVTALSHELYNHESRQSWKSIYRHDLPQLLQLQGINLPHYSSFKRWIKEDPNSKINDKRIGSMAFRRKHEPSLKFIPPEHVSDIWQIDSTRFSKPYWAIKDHDFFTVCFIRDVVSKKIVGISVGEKEEHTMVIRAIKYAVLTEGHLPRKIIGDHGSAYKHEVATNFFKGLKKHLGVVFKMLPPNSPELKAHVESGIGFIQSFCDRIPGHIGKSVRTRRLDARLSPEAHARSLKASERWSKEQVMHAVFAVVSEYNRTSIDGRPSPNAIFKTSLKPNSAEVSSEHQALLFWHTLNKRMIRRGQLEIQYKKHLYRFVLDDVEMWKQFEGQELTVKVDIDETTGVQDWGKCYLFRNDEFIGTASKMNDIHYDEDERTEDDSNQLTVIRQKKAEFRSHLKQVASETKELIAARFGDAFNLDNFLANDKDSQNTAQDNLNLSVFMEQNALRKQDQRYGKQSKVVPIEATKELEVVAEQPKEKSVTRVINRWTDND